MCEYYRNIYLSSNPEDISYVLKKKVDNLIDKLILRLKN